MWEKKVREPLNVTKELSYMMLELHNVKMKPSNVRKKKVKELPNVRKKLSYVMLELHNVIIEPSNVRKKVTWYSRLPTSGYRTPLFLGGYRRITPDLHRKWILI